MESVMVKRALLVAAVAGGLQLGAQKRDMRDFLGLGPPPDQAAAKAGEPLYKQNCAACHGENARGGEGPNLLRSTTVLHDEKGEQIGQVVKNGRPQAGMPAFTNLKADEIYNIAEYIHVQVENAANRGVYSKLYASQQAQASGDPKKGEAFFQANCASCHSGTGDLAKIGSKYAQPPEMQARLLWPKGESSDRATVKTAGGESVTGEVVRLDDFEVALRDAAGEYHYWPRDKVQVQLDDKLSGHRALLAKYTDADLHDLTAYLLTLK